jgi:hypothetical protein
MKKGLKNIVWLLLAITLITAAGCSSSKKCGCPSKKGLVGYN